MLKKERLETIETWSSVVIPASDEQDRYSSSIDDRTQLFYRSLFPLIGGKTIFFTQSCELTRSDKPWKFLE